MLPLVGKQSNTLVAKGQSVKPSRTVFRPRQTGAPERGSHDNGRPALVVVPRLFRQGKMASPLPGIDAAASSSWCCRRCRRRLFSPAPPGGVAVRPCQEERHDHGQDSEVGNKLITGAIRRYARQLRELGGRGGGAAVDPERGAGLRASACRSWVVGGDRVCGARGAPRLLAAGTRGLPIGSWASAVDGRPASARG